jgi:purine-cytosine permease-like protein
MAVVVAAMVWAGPVLVARTWIRWGAFWAALLVTIFLFWQITSEAGFGGSADAGRLWEAMDFIVGVGMLWFPLAPEIARFSGAPGSAGTAIGGGFAVPALLTMFVGAGAMNALEVSGSLDPVELVLGLVVGSVSTAFAVLLLVWLLVAEADQPFGLIFVAGSSLAGLRAGWNQRLVSFVLLAGAIAAGALLPLHEMDGWVELLISIFVPAVGVFVADFFVVRDRSYNTDTLLEGSGAYAGFNYLGIAALLVGFALYQLLVPSGPDDWVTWVSGIAGNGGWSNSVVIAQPGFVSFLVAFGIYMLFGRWVTKDDAAVTRIAGRF